MSLLEQLTQQLSGPELDQISRNLGVDREQTASAVGAALPLLIGALGRNSAKPQGASALHQALARDHDGGILDALGTFLQSPEAGNGIGILRHVLGPQQPRVERGLGQATGLDSAQIGKLLMMLAPIVLAALGRAQRKQGFDAGGLASILGAEKNRAEQRTPPGMLEALLDADGDGDVDLSDIARKGLGGLFGR
jgi:hypothetical protein